MKNGKGWYVAMAASIVLTWIGANAIMPWHSGNWWWQ